MRVQTEGGEVIDLGMLETGLTVGITDYSKRTTDDFGVTTVVPRGFSRKMSVRLGVETDEVDALQRRLADLRATSALWIADERYQWLSAQGFYKDFSLDLPDPVLSYCTLTVEGLAETETVVDAGGDPAPDGQVSTLRLLQPVAITDAVLTATNVAENDYPVWSAGATYAAGDRRVRAHRIYESVVAGNIGHDPTIDATRWIDVGPTNRWAMFDQAVGSATSASGQIVVTLSAPSLITGLAALDLDATTVRVQAPGYDSTQPVVGGNVSFLDLNVAGGGAITVTLAGGTNTGPLPGAGIWNDARKWSDGAIWADTPPSGALTSVGSLLIGRLTGLGITEASPTAGITDFSRKDVDDFGTVTVVERAWSKTMSAKALIRTDALDIVANRIAAVRAQPSLWIGQAGLDSLTIYGFFKDVSIEVGEATSKLSLSIEGLSTAPPASGAGLPAITVLWSGVVDDDGTKPAPNATNGADPSSPFGPQNTVDDIVTKVDAVVAHADDILGFLGDVLNQPGATLDQRLDELEAFDPGGNLLDNSDFSGGTAGWTLAAPAPAGFGVDVINEFDQPVGKHYLGMGQNSTDPALGGTLVSKWVTCNPGTWVQISGRLAAVGADTFLTLQWADGGGNFLAEGDSSPTTTGKGRDNYDTWPVRWVKGQVPADARFFRLTAKKTPTKAGFSNSVSGLLEPMAALASATQTVPSAYRPSGTGAALVTARARIEQVNQVATGAAGAAAQVEQDLTASYGNLDARLTTTSAVAASAAGRTAFYWGVAGSTTSSGQARVALFGDTSTNFLVEANTIAFRGNVILDGTLELSALARNQFGVFMHGAFSPGSSFVTDPGTTSDLIVLSPGYIQSGGTFIFTASVSMSANAGDVTTYNYLGTGKNLYTHIVADGGVGIHVINGGSAIGYDVGGNAGEYATREFANTLGGFSGVVKADVHNGNYDTGVVNQGDYYERYMSATYVVYGVDLTFRWTFN